MVEQFDPAKDLRARLGIPDETTSLPLETYFKPKPQTQGFFGDLAGGAIEAFRSGAADLPRVLQKVTDALANASVAEGSPPVDRTQVFKQLADFIEPKDFNDQPTLAWKIGNVFGGLAAAIPKYGPLAKLGALGTIAGFAGLDAATAWGRGAKPEKIAEEAALGAATGGLFAGARPLSRVGRMGALGAGFPAIQAVAGETKPENLAISSVTGVVLGAFGSRLPSDLQKQLNKLGYPNEVISKTPIRKAREIVRNKERFVAQELTTLPPEISPTALVPPVTYEDLPNLITKGREARASEAAQAINDPQSLIYNKILTARGFNQEEILAMPYDTKLAIANSRHNNTTVKVDPITGQLKLTGKPLIEGPTEERPFPGFGMTVEDIAVDPAVDKLATDALKAKLDKVKISKKKVKLEEFEPTTEWQEVPKDAVLPPGLEIRMDMESGKNFARLPGGVEKGIKAEEPVTEKPAKPTYNKEIVNQLKWKFGIGDRDAKKVAILLYGRGVRVPSQATEFFEKLPIFTKIQKLDFSKAKKVILPKEKSLYDRIIESEQKIKEPEVKTAAEITEETKTKEQLAKETAKFEMKQSQVELENIQAKIATAGTKLADLKKAVAVVQLTKTPTNKVRSAEIKKNIKGLENELKVLDKKAVYARERAKLAQPKTYEEHKVAIEEHKKFAARIDQTADLIDKAEKLWPGRRMDLARLSEQELTNIILNKITPDQASITPNGTLVKMKLGDKALATILGTTTQDATTLRETTAPSPLEADDAQLRAAAKFLDIPYKEILPVDRQRVINTYLQLLDDNAESAKKIEQVATKGAAPTQTFNEVISKDSKIDPLLSRLRKDVEKIKAEEIEAQAQFDAGNLDIGDLNSIQARKIKAIKTVEKRRNEISNKSSAPLKIGEQRPMGTLIKDDRGGLIVIRKVSDNIDEFQLLTKDGKPPIQGDTDLSIAGTVKIEKAKNGRPIKIEFPDTLNILQQDFFKEQFKNVIKTYYEKQGFGTPSDVGLRLRAGIDIDMLKEMKDRLKQKTIDIYTNFANRKGPNAKMPREDMNSAMKDMFEAEKIKFNETELRAMQAEAMNEGIFTEPTRNVSIEKGVIPRVKLLDTFGQALANDNPDIKLLSQIIQKRDKTIEFLNSELIHGEKGQTLSGKEGALRRIFAKINQQPNAEELKTTIGREMLAETKGWDKKGIQALADILGVSEERAKQIKNVKSNHPLVIEAKEDLRVLMENMKLATELEKRGFIEGVYFPLLVHPKNTFIKLQGMFENIKNRSELPQRYWAGGEPVMSELEFAEIKAILSKKSWDNLSVVEKNKIRYAVLQYESIFDDYAFVPPDIQERVPKKAWNRHLQPRKGGELLEYQLNAEDVFKQYLYTMIRAEATNEMLKEAAQIMNKYPSTGGARDILSVRTYMDRLIKQALGTRTMGAQVMAGLIDRLNDMTDREVMRDDFPARLAGRLTTQTARGALGPDTAIRNITDIIKIPVQHGISPTMNALYKIISGNIPEATKKYYHFLLGDVFQEMELKKGLRLTERLKRAETIPGKALGFYDWISDMALTPLRATEHFNRFLSFVTALDEAGKKGYSFEKGVRLGLLQNAGIITDTIIPSAYWKATQDTLVSQFGYTRNLRNPLLRGPLAKVSTIFWGYPFNQVQFVTRGLTSALQTGDMGMLTRYGLYLGFQLSIAAAVVKLGLDFSSIFGIGLLPVKWVSVPWDVLKGAYQSQFGRTADDRSRGAEDFLNSGGMLTVPQFRYGTKILKQIKNIEEGYQAAGKRELPLMETTPFNVIMSLTGFPVSGPREVYNLVTEMSDTAGEYKKEKQDLVLKGIKALDKGSMADVRNVFDKAKKDNIKLTTTELYKYHRIHKMKTYLQSHMERLPKHLRPAIQKRIQELDKRLNPSRFGGEEEAEERSMWSRPSQVQEEEE